VAVATVILSVRDAASGPLDDIADASRDATAQLARTDNALDKTGASASAAGGRIGGAASALSSLSATGGGAVVAGLGGVAAVLLSVAASAALAVGSLGAATLVADDALASLEGFQRIGSDFYPSVPPATIASIEAANAAIDALVSIAAKMAVVVGGAAAPAIEQIASFTVGLALATLDLVEVLTAGEDVFRSLTEFILTGFYKALTLPIVPLQELVRAMLLLADTVGVKLPAPAREAADALLSMQSDMASATVEMILGTSAATGLSEKLAGLTERGRDFIGTQQAATAAMERGSAATKDAAAATDALAEARKRLLADSAAEFATTFQARESPQIEFLTEFYDRLKQASGQRDFQMLLADLAVGMDRYRLTIEQTLAAQEALMQGAAGGGGSAIGAAAAGGATTRGQEALSTLQAGTAAASSLSGLTQLDPTGISGAVVAGMQSVIDISNGGGVTGDITALLEGLAAALPEFIPALVDFATNLLTSLIPGLADGLVGVVESLGEALPDLIQGLIGGLGKTVSSLLMLVPKLLIEAVGMLLSPRFWIDMGKAFVDGLLDLLNPFKNEDGTGVFQRNGSASRTGGALKDLFNGKKDTSNLTVNGAIAADMRDFNRKLLGYNSRSQTKGA
jgi:hypothetical protein